MGARAEAAAQILPGHEFRHELWRDGIEQLAANRQPQSVDFKQKTASNMKTSIDIEST